MTDESVRDNILRATEAGGKSYSFDEGHPRDRPIDLFFQHTPEGLVLFVVFYSLACRFAACLGCNLPATSSLHHVDFRLLMRQIDWVFAEPRVREHANDIQKVIVSNQGSVLDEMTFSSTALLYLVAMLNTHLPSLRVLSLETRAEYIDEAELEVLARAIKEAHDPAATIELALGFEAFDEHVRNHVYKKGLSLAAVERTAALAARRGFLLKCYFMLKPAPGMSDAAAVQDVHHAIDYLADLAARYRCGINLHLNPTFAARGTPLATAFAAGQYQPPTLRDVARAALHARGKPISIFLGLNDEGLAVAGGSFLRPGDDAQVALLERFNQTQDFEILLRFIAES
jgi:hypothetical protein